LEIDLVSSEDGTQTGMVEMIMVINLPKITKSESISMLVYQKLVYQKFERTLATVTITTARPGIIIGKGGQVDKLKEELKKITDKEVQINI
jgi:ribosomal protein S3